MPSPKSGRSGSAVTPSDPQKAVEADNAVPGKKDVIKAKQRQTQASNAKTKPYKPPQSQEEAEKKNSWIEIEMVGEDGRPITGEAYRVILPDGKTAAEGTLDEKGFARIDGIEPGNCKICFTNLDQEAWERT